MMEMLYRIDEGGAEILDGVIACCADLLEEFTASMDEIEANFANHWVNAPAPSPDR
ncbi:hypothetical protein [Streptomyces hainanensis]|uniref:hypothetical protein n=1 Tax=Streptomyces hainanensis TaxID=402648 RepID=UPI001404F533|nr:hypothetical protein [Streptomyces hainanensis]